MTSINQCRCGRAALPTDPDGLCERCVLASHGVDVADGERWEWGRLFGEQLDDKRDWAGYTIDYIGRVCQVPSSEFAATIHRDHDMLELFIHRVFYQDGPVYAEIVWTPDSGTRAAIRGIENAQEKTCIDRAWRGFALLGHFHAGRVPLELDTSTDRRELVQKAKRLKQANQSLLWEHVAARLGVPKSTLDTWRRKYR